jgi:hypothetical protein
LDEHLVQDPEDGGVLLTEDGEPSTFREAQNSSEKTEWMAAMQRELKSLEDSQTWKLVKLPSGQRMMDCKWVYKLKTGSKPGEKIFKARLVAKGFTQRHGVDYNEVYSPVAKYSSIRLLCA